MKNNLLIFFLISYSVGLSAQTSPVLISCEQILNKEYPKLEDLYKSFHSNPELSLQEKNTSLVVASELKAIGYEVTESFGGYGVVAILKNGMGPNVLIRTDMDALPVEEQTDLPYASKVRSTDKNGNEVSVMHACGHDLHLTVFLGTAKVLYQTMNNWKGTLILVAQPAEEIGKGAKMMFKQGLYTKFPVPDFAIALHSNAFLPAGKVGVRSGYIMAGVDWIDITVYGEGGHGASPQNTKDPIVLAAQMILALQTISSREVDPVEPFVLSVGSIHGGTSHNIIPGEVKLQLTLRSFSSDTRSKALESIKRIAIGQAVSAGLPESKYPKVIIDSTYVPATFNDPALMNKLESVFVNTFGQENVEEIQPYMVGEDFSMFAKEDRSVPTCLFWLGTVDPELYERSKQNKTTLPGLHSSTFAPSPELSIKTGVKAMSAAAFNLLNE